MLNAAFNMERYTLRLLRMFLFFLSFIPLVEYSCLLCSLVKHSYLSSELSKVYFNNILR